MTFSDFCKYLGILDISKSLSLPEVWLNLIALHCIIKHLYSIINKQLHYIFNQFNQKIITFDNDGSLTLFFHGKICRFILTFWLALMQFPPDFCQIFRRQQ